VPKDSLTLNAFEGGLNLRDDPRDIGGDLNNQLSFATGVDLQYRGRIVTMVSGKDTSLSLTLGNQANGTAGYGLFSFSADYDAGGTLNDTDYYLHCVDGLVVSKESDGTNANSLEMDTGSNNSKPAFFVADGGVRMSDGEFGNNTDVQHVRYVINNGVGALGTAGAWIKAAAELSPPPSVVMKIDDIGAAGSIPTTGIINILLPEDAAVEEETANGWGAGDDAGIAASTSTVKWEFGASFVYDEDQETTITTATAVQIGDSGATDVNLEALSGTDAAYARFTTGNKFKIGLGIYTNSTSGLSALAGKERITMVKVYMRKMNGGTPWFLCGEFNTKENAGGGGGRAPFEDDYNDWTASGAGDYTYGALMATPPQAITFRSETGYDADSGITYKAEFQTGCVVNRRAYIGNVKQAGSVFGDRLLKTGPNQFDLYPEGNWIDVVINDGDYITTMVVYSDRIFQFKRRNLYLLNVAEDTEFLEGQYLNYGVMHPSQVCVGSYGVMWLNEHGCFRYDGESVIDMTADKIPVADWGITESSSSVPGISYSEQLRKLFICPDLSDTGSTFDGTGGWSYDMVYEGWSKLPTGFFATGKKSNFHIDFKGNVCYMAGSTLYKIGTTATTATDYDVRTKDLDFKAVGVKKKIYKTYITYKCSSDSNVKVAYAIDGDDGSWTDITSELLSTSGEWDTVALTSKTDAYSYRIRLYDNGTTVPASFEVNDISITYRIKTAK